jgi:two-component system, OmpR family, sensor histidine kinase VanS
MSARLRLTLSYAAFLVVAGAAALFGVYVVLRYVPDYPLTAADPRAGGNEVASRQQILEAVVGASAAILGALAVIGLAGGWVLAGRILRPLKALNEAAAIAATGRLDHRVRLSGRVDEFGQLADSFDHMLDRLDDAFATQERFAANASHELRTPLAVMATMLEVARADPDGQDYEELLERLQITNDRAIGLTQALLRLSDANAVTAAAEPLDLGEIVAEALEEAAPEGERREVSLTSHLDPAPLIGDEALLRQLVANLVQNAIRHNHRGGDVVVGTSRDAATSRVELRIENSGDAYTAAAAAQLAEPFLRGAGRTTRGDSERGYGLGLALVERIAAVHDGTLTIAPRPGGGLIAAVTLPARGAVGQPTRAADGGVRAARIAG